mmetsp:Transcript_54323/g.151253  ORF Transcript_54323/g.151253 Transcript_54323/m.151253 type:complete len:343 (+) Transcript_54323:122-1150(+)
MRGRHTMFSPSAVFQGQPHSVASAILFVAVAAVVVSTVDARECTDVPTNYMLMRGFSCPSFWRVTECQRYGEGKCANSNWWKKYKFCEKSCMLNGCGYDDDPCSLTPSPTPPPAAPTLSPTSGPTTTLDCSMTTPVAGTSPGTILDMTIQATIENCYARCLEDASCWAIVYHGPTGFCSALPRTYDAQAIPSTHQLMSNKRCGGEASTPTPPPPLPPAPPPPAPAPVSSPSGDCTPLDGEPIDDGAVFHDCDGQCPGLTATKVCEFLGKTKDPEQPERQAMHTRTTLASAVWYTGDCGAHPGFPGATKVTKTHNGVTNCKITFPNKLQETTWATMKCNCPVV